MAAASNKFNYACRCGRKRLALAVLLLLAAAGLWAAGKIARINRAVAALRGLGGKVVVVRSPDYEGSTLLGWYCAAGRPQRDARRSGRPPRRQRRS